MENDNQPEQDSGNWLEVTVSEPIVKCLHGVYIAKGDVTARHCGACNPDCYTDRVLLATMARRKPACRVYAEPKTLDAAAFMEQSPSERMASTRDFYPQADTL